MGHVGIDIAISLWQVALALFLAFVTVVGATFTVAITFVRRSECLQHGSETSSQFKQLFDLVREIKADVGKLEGKTGN